MAANPFQGRSLMSFSPADSRGMALPYGASTSSPGGYGGMVASLPGGQTQSGAGAYGTVPTMPNPATTQASALAANLSQMDQIKSIMAQINQQSAQSAMLPMTLNLPGYQGAMGQAMGNVQQNLAGQVPGDVWTQMQQGAAERGIGMGSPTSPNANAAMLRALGLTSLGLQQTGQQNLTNLMGAVPRGTLYDPSQMLVTPAQQQEAQYMSNVLAAAPNPAQAAAAEEAAIQRGIQAGQGAGGTRAAAMPTTVSFPSAGGTKPYTPAYTDIPQNAYAGSYTTPIAGDPYARWQQTQPTFAGPTVASSTWETPADTYYNPVTNQSSYNYGIPDYWGTQGTSWGNQPVSSGQMLISPKQDWYQSEPAPMTDFELMTGMPESESASWGWYD